jgi:hypothetical protein
MCDLKRDYTKEASREMRSEESGQYFRSDGNGGYNVSKALAWIIGLVLPILAGFAGVGISQMISLATIQEQVSTNTEAIDRLQDWGPQSGDRYSANDARADWKMHEIEHDAIVVNLFEEISDIKERLSSIETEMKK